MHCSVTAASLEASANPCCQLLEARLRVCARCLYILPRRAIGHTMLLPLLILLCAPGLWGQYNESLCSVCEKMVTEVQYALKSDVSMELADAILQDMCANSLEDVATVCNFLVDGYLPSVMDITTTLAYELCPLLDLCQSYSPFQTPTPKHLKLSECTLCRLASVEFAMGHKHLPLSPELAELLAGNMKCREDIVACATSVSFLFSRLLGAGARARACDQLDSCSEEGGEKLLPGSKYCIFCRVIVNQAQGSLNSMNSNTFESMLENLCEGLPSQDGKDEDDLEKQCEELKEKYSSVMLEILQKVEPSIFCGMFNICSSSETDMVAMEYKPDRVDSSVCFICQTAFQYLTELLQDGDMDTSIVSLMEKVCYTLPSGVSSQCYNFVSTYGAFFLSKFASMIGSAALCNSLPGCYNATEEWKLSDDTRALISSVALYQPEGLGQNNQDELACSWCTYMVGQLAPVILNESGDFKKNKVFNNSCSLLPSNFDNVDCNSCRQKYDSTITSLIKDGKHPYEICHQYIHCCRLNDSVPETGFDLHAAYYWIGREALAPFSSAPGHRYLLGKHKDKAPPPPPPPDQAQCMACEFLVASVYEDKHPHLPLPRVPGHERRELKHSCKEVPKGYKDVCEKAAKKMARTEIHKYKLHHGSPPKACSAVGQCKSKSTGRHLFLPLQSQQVLLYGMQDSINTCVLCKLVAGVIAVQMKAANLTINLVEYMVQTVCNMMQRDECWDVVDSLKTIIRKVGQYVDPADVCVNTGFCSEAALPFMPAVAPYPPLEA